VFDPDDGLIASSMLQNRNAARRQTGVSLLTSRLGKLNTDERTNKALLCHIQTTLKFLYNHVCIEEGRIVMFTRNSLSKTEGSVEVSSNKGLLIGVAGSLAAIALLAKQKRSRRHEDHDAERRNPFHFFLANKNARRREIDRSGKRPLFERRQSVYEKY
jgi:hypothetical protein